MITIILACYSLVYRDRNEKSYRGGTAGGLEGRDRGRKGRKERETTEGGKEG